MQNKFKNLEGEKWLWIVGWMVKYKRFNLNANISKC
jgi:hypothetical protein